MQIKDLLNIVPDFEKEIPADGSHSFHWGVVTKQPITSSLELAYGVIIPVNVPSDARGYVTQEFNSAGKQRWSFGNGDYFAPTVDLETEIEKV